MQYVNNANEEIDALNDILPTETAVVDVKFKEQLKGVTAVSYTHLDVYKRQIHVRIYVVQNKFDTVLRLMTELLFQLQADIY